MTPQLKQRLIGAGVIVACAVIFIPMLLDEDALQSSFDRDRLEITPPSPDRATETPRLDDGLLERATRGARAVPDEAAPGDTRSRLPAPREPQSSDPEVAPAPMAVAPTKVGTESNAAATAADATQDIRPEKSAGTSDPARLPSAAAAQRKTPPVLVPTAPPAVAEPVPEPEAWVVQLGVYRDESTARALEKRLREAGYKAFVDTVPADGAAYRVRVGPEGKRANAETTRAQLQQLLRLNGFVVPHP